MKRVLHREDIVVHKKTFIAWFLLALTLLSGCSQKTLDLADYLLPNVPMMYEQFSLFPEREALRYCTVERYQSETFSSVMFDDIYFLLRCGYSGFQMEQELQRLQELGAEYREDLFAYPGYVMLFDGQNYEYALIDEGASEIIYIAAMTVDFEVGSELYGSIYGDFPDSYRPIGKPDGAIDKYRTG